MTTNAQKWNLIDVIEELQVGPKDYRLWFETPITAGNPIVILVHGAVVPLPGKFHDPHTINNKRYCFYDLDSLLYQDFQFNVFTFEYADECVRDPITNNCIPDSTTNEDSYFKYGDITKYGGKLQEAIGFAKNTARGQMVQSAQSLSLLIAWGADSQICCHFGPRGD